MGSKNSAVTSTGASARNTLSIIGGGIFLKPFKTIDEQLAHKQANMLYYGWQNETAIFMHCMRNAPQVSTLGGVSIPILRQMGLSDKAQGLTCCSSRLEKRRRNAT